MTESHECHAPNCGCHPDKMPQNNDAIDPNATNPESEFPADVPIPAPTLLTLTTALATQAMVSMGIFPHPITGRSEFLLHQARHLIDTVSLLNDKTTGNQTEEETATLNRLVHELHVLFVAAQNEKAKRETPSA